MNGRNKKPQDNNPELAQAIIELNFQQPLVFSTHPFIKEILKWKPRPHRIFKSKRNVPTLKSLEVSNKKEFDSMIKYLKQTPEWAVDVEHHDASSYSGITCLIQICTPSVAFLIDPFTLNKEIKQSLKPLMESPNHVKVLHACFNDLKWLQRDFNIFTWPVIDTQIIYRKIKLLQNKEHDNNVSLVNIVQEYFPSVKLNKDCTFEDFRKRPIPEHIKKYAIDDVLYLLPLLDKLRDDFDENTNRFYNESFEDLLMDCALNIAKKALYSGKYYLSAEDDIKRLGIPKADQTLFKELHNWRHDLARLIDENPDSILFVRGLAQLSSLKRPARLHKIQEILSEWPSGAIKPDASKIKDIIDRRRYDFFDSCPECGENVIVLPGMKKAFDTHPKRLSVDWSPQLTLPEGVNGPFAFNIEELRNNKELAAAMGKHVFNISKFPYSRSRQMSIYSFTTNQLSFFIAEITKCIKKVELLLKCSTCHSYLEHAVIPVCCTGNYLSPCCQECCWASKCPKCKVPKTKDSLHFDAVDRIFHECDVFLKRIKMMNCVDRAMAIATFLRNCEMEVMCDYCFGHLNKATLISRTAKSETKRFSVCCQGCDYLFMESYGKDEKKIPSKLLDQVCSEIITTLKTCLENCKQEQPNISDPYSGLYPEVSVHRKKALALLKEQESNRMHRDGIVLFSLSLILLFTYLSILLRGD